MKKKVFIKNFGYSALFQIIIFVFGFFVPKIVISTYGSEVQGLSASINQVINILHLLQAGAIVASIYSMYKPIENNDEKLICLNYQSAAYFFRKTGFIFLFLAVLVSLLSPLYVKSNDIKNFEIILSFLILSSSGAITFFFVAKLEILFASFQKRYIVNISNIIEKIVYYILLFVFIHFKFDFIFMYLSILIGNIIRILILQLTAESMYSKYLHCKVDTSKLIKIPNRFNVMIISISEQIVSAAPIILITVINGLEFASIYSIFYILTRLLISLVMNIFYSVNEILGATVAADNQFRIRLMFDQFNYLYFIFSVLIIIPSYFLINSFVMIYIGTSSEVNYLYPFLGKSMVLYSLLLVTFLPLRSKIFSFGLFNLISKSLIVLTFISIFIATLFTIFNFQFAVFGPIIYYSLLIIVTILMLNKMNFQYLDLLKKQIRRLLFTVSMIVIISIILNLFKIEINNLINWIFIGSALFMTCFLGVILYTVIFERDKYYTIKKMIFRS